jgi:alpha-1,3-rhamnosyl/mannosyltransferase
VFHGTRHLVPFRSARPTVMTVHDLGPLTDQGFTLAKRLLLPDQYRRSLRAADALIAVSEATRDRLLDHLPDVAETVIVIPTPPPTAVVDAVPVSVERVAALSRFFLYVGDLSPRKDVGFLLSLWTEIGERLGAPLVLVGADGWRADPVLEAIAAAEATGHVIRLGLVSDGELRWLYERAAAVVSASRYEGTGLPIAEALALGTPVVINDEPALKETAAGDAIVVPTTDRTAWADALLGIVDHAPARTPRPAQAEDAWADAVVAVYRRLLAARRKASA